MNSSSKSWLLLIILSCIWGSSFILMKLGMHTTSGEEIFSHQQVAALRMSMAGLVLIPFAIKALHYLKSWKNILRLAIVGFCGNFFPAFLFTFAETGISSGYAGMLNSFTPIFALVIGFSFFKNRLTPTQIIGVTIGTLGIISLTLSGSDVSLTGSWLHIGAVILATLCYAISLNTIKYTLQHIKGTHITALSFLIILAPSLIMTLLSGSVETIQHNEFAMQGLGFIAILSVVGTAFAVAIFNILISNSSVLSASSVTYLIPVVAVIIGLAFNEHINIYQIGSMLIILSGVFVANYLPRLMKSKK